MQNAIRLAVEDLEGRLAPSAVAHDLKHDTVLLATTDTITADQNVQLVNCTPTAALPDGITIKIKVTITMSDDTTWSQTYSFTGTLTATQVRDLLMASLKGAGFTVTASGDNAFIVSARTITNPDGTTTTVGIKSVVFTVVDGGDLAKPEKYLPTVSGTTSGA